MRKLLLVLVLLLIPASLFAQDWRNRRTTRDRYGSGYDLANKFELTPFVGYTWGGTIYANQTSVFNNDVDAASSGNIGADFAIPIRDGFKIELMATHQNTKLQTGGGLFEPNNRVANIDVNYYQAGIQIPFAVGRNISPFVIVTAGVANLSPDIPGVSSSTRFAMTAGGGVKVPINPNVGFRFDIRGMVTQLGNNSACNSCNYGYNDTFYQGQANFGVFFSF
jgi:opacity protein-like surface antigen